MNNIPELTPNVDIVNDKDTNSSIKIEANTVGDIQINVTKANINTIDSMAPNNVESIGPVKL